MHMISLVYTTYHYHSISYTVYVNAHDITGIYYISLSFLLVTQYMLMHMISLVYTTYHYHSISYTVYVNAHDITGIYYISLSFY